MPILLEGDEQETLENTLQTVFFADWRKAKIQQYPLQMTDNTR